VRPWPESICRSGAPGRAVVPEHPARASPRRGRTSAWGTTRRSTPERRTPRRRFRGHGGRRRETRPVPGQLVRPRYRPRCRNVAAAQETAFSCPWGSASVGCVHERPFQSEGPPSAARQNEAVAHEIWFAAPHAPTFPDHDRPLKTKEFTLTVDGHAKGRAPRSRSTRSPARPGSSSAPTTDVPLKSTAWFRLGTAARRSHWCR